MSVDKALRIARESGGLNMLKVPHLHPHKIKEPRAEKFAKHINAGVHSGPIHSTVAGRTDHLPMGVPDKSYVLPADIPSAIGEGNTAAGFKALKRAYGGVPYASGSAPYGQSGGPYGMAKGGEIHGDAGSVPIVAAGGEFVVHPHHVWEAGNGDIELGHKVHDLAVKRIRAELIKTLKKLPPPKTD